MLIAGIDLSLTATGIALIDTEAKAFGDEPVVVHTLRSKGVKGDGLASRARRLRLLADAVETLVYAADYAVIEQPAFSQTGGSHHDRSGLWWITVERLASRAVSTVEIPPTSLKKYVTGKGNASKMEVMAKLIRLMPDVELGNDNEADALGLALMGARKFGHPLEPSLPLANLEVMEKIKWP